MDIEAIQSFLRDKLLDGWLLADFHGRNDIAVNVLQLEGIVTRRSFYFIPVDGEPTALTNVIESAKFQSVPGRIIAYSGYKQLESELRTLLEGKKKIAMEYSALGRLPYIGLVDAGTIELVRMMGPEVVSSADLVAQFQAILTSEQITSHRTAAKTLIEIKDLALNYIGQSVRYGNAITEHDVCTFIRGEIEKSGMSTASGPICAVGAHAGDPHYEPVPGSSSKMEKGQLILIDLWARIKGEQTVYGDITWMGYTGPHEEIPAKYHNLFSVVVRARDAAVSFLKENLVKRSVCGSEADDACREIVRTAGYGEYFTHRTGHSITTTEHGTGPNIDNLEAEDKRTLQPGHLFSIEPGIYMSDCGFRTEIDVLVADKGCEVTTLPLQTEIQPLF